MKQITIPLLVSIALVSVVFVFFESLELYFSDLLNAAESNQTEYALLSFLVLSSDIVLPVPSSIVMYGNGLVLGLIKGALLSLFAVFISSSIGYYLGKVSNYKASSSEKATAIMQKYGALGIIITRGIPILSESIVFTAGYNRLNFRFFTLLNLIGYLPVCFIYAYFGNLAQNTNLFLISFAASLVVSLILWVFGRKLIAQFFNVHTS
ncbi:MAG: VTT domain-containing protein [Roseivirga sp.]|nr:VTT domain-containing protein [Roseivirga sp.]